MSYYLCCYNHHLKPINYNDRKKTGFIALIVALLCCMPAQAQLGGLINKGKSAVNKAKEVKEKVDEEIKKSNGDVDFYYLDNHRGFYRSKNRKIVFDDLHKDGNQQSRPSHRDWFSGGSE